MSKYGITGGTLVDGVAVSGTKYSTVLVLQRASEFSLHMVWDSTSALNATATLQVSNKPNPDETSDTDWVDNTDITFTDPGGADLSEFIHVSAASGALYRVKFVNGSGTGTLTVYAAYKNKY